MKSTLIIIIILLCSQGYSNFEKDDKLLIEHQKSSGEKIKIYYVGLGATTNDVIQVRKENQDNPIWVSEKYYFIKSSRMLSDTSLQLVLSDTGYHNYSNRFDTVIADVK